MTVPHCPHLPGPPVPSRPSTLSTSPGQGDAEVCNGIQENLFLLPFLGAAWAKPKTQHGGEKSEASRK